MDSLAKSCGRKNLTCDVWGPNGMELQNVLVNSVKDCANKCLASCGEQEITRQTRELRYWALPAPIKGNIYNVGLVVGWLVGWLVGCFHIICLPVLISLFVGLFLIFQFRCIAIPERNF